MTAPPLWRALAFEAETFGAELFALCRAVPLLDHLLCRLDEMHDPILVEDRVLRDYQRDLAVQGYFEIALPLTGAALRSGRSVILAEKTTFFGVQGRRDLLLAAARVGFAFPLCAVVLPLHRTVVTIQGTHWNVDRVAAQRALAVFEAAGADWSDTLAPHALETVIVTGDANYAHHLWNQLGALDALLAQCARVRVLATHQPIAPIADIFADHPGLTVQAVPESALPRLDPLRVQPFAPGGKIVVRAVRERILPIAARHATRGVRHFLAQAEAQGLQLIWLSVRALGRTATNQSDALLALGDMLLRDGRFGIVLDGYSRPHDDAGNPDYDRAAMLAALPREQALGYQLIAGLAARHGPAVATRIFLGIGCDLLDSIHLAAHCRAYFAHHGTLQHKIGYFTKVPGMVHSNPNILGADPAGGHRHVTEDPGVIEYVDAALVDDVPGADGALAPNNAYRFNDIPAVVTAFADFLTRQGIR